MYIKNLKKYLIIAAGICILAGILGCASNIETPSKTVTSITVQGAGGGAAVVNGGTLQMSATVLPDDATDKSVTWSVTPGTGTASISQDGLLTATSPGTVTTKATAKDGSAIVGTREITVTAADAVMVTDITVTGEGNAIEVLLDETLQMSATVLPDDATDKSVTWSVTPGTGTATITESGLLTGTGAGTVIVKAVANDGSIEEGTLEITVNAPPSITSTFPVDGATGVSITSVIEATFSELMDESTVVGTNFTVSGVSGAVAYDRETKTVTFTPSGSLAYETTYTATITTMVKDESGIAMAENKVWTFTTASMALAGVGPAPINLRTAADFSILGKTAITTTGNTSITGDIGLSPAALSDLTGFSQTLASDGTHATSSIVTGKIYAADNTNPTPAKLTTAISDVETAYTDAAGRVDYSVTQGIGETIGGQTFPPGIYKWDSVLTISSDITLSGNENDIWIFQISGGLTASTGARVLLNGGAQAKNIFWQVAEVVTVGVNAHLEGIVMGQTQIVLETGSSVHGRLLAQSQITLNAATVTPPNIL